MTPTVSVIVPVFDDRPSLERCLDSLRRQVTPGVRPEIVVVDNGSGESLEDLGERDKRVRIIREGTPGSYVARNAGISAARGQILAFTDADCVPAPAWLSAGVAALLQENGPAIVGGRVRMFVPEGTSRTAAALYDLCLGLRQEKYWSEGGFFVTANMFVPATVFKEVGLFRTDVFSGGDAEWSRRAAERGVALRYAPEAVVEHPVRADWRSLRRKVLRIAHGGSDPVYRTALDRSRRQRRGGSGKLTAARRVLRSRELRNWRERAIVFLMAMVVVVWKLEGKLRYRLNREAYR